MKVILTTDVKGTGKKGDLVEVNDGFGRNFLLKKNLAKEATSVNVNSLKQQKEAEAYRRAQELKEAKELAEKLKTAKVELKVRCGENGKVFGSVTSKEISATLAGMGYDVDKKKITLKEPIKNAGTYSLEVKLMADISAKITVVVTNA